MNLLYFFIGLCLVSGGFILGILCILLAAIVAKAIENTEPTNK